MMDLGFLGLGQMGSAIAERLGKDMRLHVFDPAATAMARFRDLGALRRSRPRRSLLLRRSCSRAFRHPRSVSRWQKSSLPRQVQCGSTLRCPPSADAA